MSTSPFHPFKTLAGAIKRAAFEQAHQADLPYKRKVYRYSVEPRPDGMFYVVRVAVVK